MTGWCDVSLMTGGVSLPDLTILTFRSQFPYPGVQEKVDLLAWPACSILKASKCLIVNENRCPPLCLHQVRNTWYLHTCSGIRGGALLVRQANQVAGVAASQWKDL